MLGKYSRAAIAADHGLCTEIARKTLLAGGNAIDGAISALFCAGITNPHCAGIGGGFQMTLYNRFVRPKAES